MGLLVGLLDPVSLDEIGLAFVLSLVGGLLNFAFRSDAGPVCMQWQRARRAGPAVVYRTYEHGGPVAWRLAVGMLLGAGLQSVL